LGRFVLAWFCVCWAAAQLASSWNTRANFLDEIRHQQPVVLKAVEPRALQLLAADRSAITTARMRNIASATTVSRLAGRGGGLPKQRG
jgi:hypothetical protein